MEFRGDFDPCVKIVEQPANLLGRRDFAALGNGVALKANDAAQASQIVCDPVIGLGQSDASIFDLNWHFFRPLYADRLRFKGPKLNKKHSKSNGLVACLMPLWLY